MKSTTFRYWISTALLITASSAHACWPEDEPTFWSHFLKLEGAGEVAKNLLNNQVPSNTLKKLLQYSYETIRNSSDDCQAYREQRSYFQGQLDVMLDFPQAFQQRMRTDDVTLAVVKANGLNIRDEPDRYATQRGSLEQDQLVRVHDHMSNGWKHVQTADNWGYISGKPQYLTLLPANGVVALGADMPGTFIEEEVPEVCEQIVAHVGGTQNGINIRQQASSKSGKLVAIPENGALCVQSKRKYGGGKWYKVLYQGSPGYVFARYVRF